MYESTYEVHPVLIAGMKGTPPRWAVIRIMGDMFWYALTTPVNPDWRTWPTKEDAKQWTTVDTEALDDYPFWGC